MGRIIRDNIPGKRRGSRKQLTQSLRERQSGRDRGGESNGDRGGAESDREREFDDASYCCIGSLICEASICHILDYL